MTFVFLHVALFPRLDGAQHGADGPEALRSFPLGDGDDRLGGGDVSLRLRADQPEPAGVARRAPRGAGSQISLLAEHEITRLVERLEASPSTSEWAEHLGVEGGRALDLDELKQDVAPQSVLHALDEADDRPAG
jgi:hypothetical protein